MIKNIIYSFIIAFILFGAYVEINPQMTNIWWRINSSGDKQLVISNLFLLSIRENLSSWKSELDILSYVVSYVCGNRTTHYITINYKLVST